MNGLINLSFAALLGAFFTTQAFGIEEMVLEGHIKEITPQSIVLSRADLDKDVLFAIDRETEFEGKMKRLEKGDRILIEYKKDGQQNIAIAVNKLKQL